MWTRPVRDNMKFNSSIIRKPSQPVKCRYSMLFIGKMAQVRSRIHAIAKQKKEQVIWESMPRSRINLLLGVSRYCISKLYLHLLYLSHNLLNQKRTKQKLAKGKLCDPLGVYRIEITNSAQTSAVESSSLKQSEYAAQETGSISAALSGPAFVPQRAQTHLPSQRLVTELTQEMAKIGFRRRPFHEPN